MKRIGLFLGLIVILISNAVALIGVSVNRSAGPIQTIELTERELPMQPRDKDDSSIRLRLAWRRSAYQFFPRLDAHDLPFDRAKLQELGFDCAAETTEDPGYRQPISRELYVALEYEGKAWEQWQKDHAGEPGNSTPKAAAAGNGGPVRMFESYDGTSREGTRLFPVDASANLDTLRQRYSDRSKYLVVRASIAAVLEGGPEARTGVAKPYRWGGYISQILPPEIHIPLPYARELSVLPPQPGGVPRYRVTLRYGSKLEPWVGEVQLLTR